MFRPEAGHLQVIFHKDDKTPVEFVLELLHSVFGKQLADAFRFTESVDKYGRATCGSIRATLPTSCLKPPGNVSGPQVIRS